MAKKQYALVVVSALLAGWIGRMLSNGLQARAAQKEPNNNVVEAQQ